MFCYNNSFGWIAIFPSEENVRAETILLKSTNP